VVYLIIAQINNQFCRQHQGFFLSKSVNHPTTHLSIVIEHEQRAHSPQLAAKVSLRTTINRPFPRMEDSLQAWCRELQNRP
jgi:hypothetical protein